ncbi:thiamine pyrophosphate-dependent enzyme, partial [Klebsiella pneumoniae]|nr:thiamine pyrophosphate-dependent enzyme [Klebsiella pneumoniae]
IFDNRRMAAISSLQVAQYGATFKTHDAVAVDYAALAGSVAGVLALHGGFTADRLTAALARAYAHDGFSVVHVPVHAGDDPLA